MTSVSLADARLTGLRHDANWISYPAGDDWMDQYWAGNPHPQYEPIWEQLAEGRLVLLGTELRNQAFERIRSEFPASLLTLETARMACWIGSDVGNVAAFLSWEDNAFRLDYWLDWRGADEPTFIKGLVDLKDSGHPIHPVALSLISRGAFVLPDFTPYGFTRSLSEMASR